MLEKNTPRLILIGLVVALAAYALYPTIRHFGLSEEEREAMRADGTLEQLEDRIIRQGLDLRGGMHLVLEVDLPTLMDNVARYQDEPFRTAIGEAKSRSEESGESFTETFFSVAEGKGLRLERYFMGLTDDRTKIKEAVREQAEDAVNRALQIIQNRVDQFGVAEPTIQKQGDRRIIVELAGISDPQRARDLIQSTALLEFVLLKESETTQKVFEQIDAALSGRTDLTFLTSLSKSAADTSRLTDDQQPAPTTDLFGVADTTKKTATDTAAAAVDEELFKERPFTALLSGAGGDIAVAARNEYAVKRLLTLPEVHDILFASSGRLALTHKPEEFTSQTGVATPLFLLYHLEKDAGLTGGVIRKATATIGSSGSSVAGQPIVSVEMSSEGAKVWSRLTGANVDKRVAIVLDGKVHMAPVIRTKIADGRTQIEGFDSMDEAKDIAIVLRAGALPAPVTVVEERTVGPSLGRDSIRQGYRAGLLGLALVMLFMATYYRWAGMLANFAMIWNIVLVLAVLALLKATLTLPGIAGLILTMGMSVDANVIIFERIREELLLEKTVRSSLETGFARALTAIIDSNVTTILAALVLWQFGTGPVKGFATTLFWGIAISMFTAVFMTRTIFNLIASRRVLTRLSI